MATIMSQLNLKMMVGSKHDKVLAYPSCCTRQVITSINFPKSLNHKIYCNSRLLSTAYHCTRSSLREDYYCNNDADPFAAEKVVMMMKPGTVGKSTNPGPSIRNFVDTISRILASLLTYGVVFTFLTVPACLYASNSALAASNRKISGSSSSSSSPSSYDAALSYYRLGYMSNDHSVDDESSITHTCTCDTSCSDCIDCEIRKNGYKVEEVEDEEHNSSTNSCSCNCHSTCYFHQKPDDHLYYNILGCIVLAAIALVIVIPQPENVSDGNWTMLNFQGEVLGKKNFPKET